MTNIPNTIIAELHPFSVYEKRLIVIFFDLYSIQKNRKIEIIISEQMKRFNIITSWWYTKSKSIVQGISRKIYFEKYGEIELFEEVNYNKGIFTLVFNKKLEELLVMKKTNYNIEEFMTLLSTHAQYLYGLFSLCHANNKDSVVIDIEEFKIMLGVEGKYKSYKELKVELLRKVDTQIHKKTSLKYKWRGISTGAGYSRIEFYEISKAE